MNRSDNNMFIVEFHSVKCVICYRKKLLVEAGNLQQTQAGILVQITVEHGALQTELLQGAIQNDQVLNIIQNSQRKTSKIILYMILKPSINFSLQPHLDVRIYPEVKKKMERPCNVYFIMSFFFLYICQTLLKRRAVSTKHKIKYNLNIRG